MTKITTYKMTDARALEALDASQFSAHGYCNTCAGWMVSDCGETRRAHTKDCEWVKARDYLSARLASTSPAPDGWVLVPIEPPKGMLRKFIGNVDLVDAAHSYAAMIAAAPQPVVEKDNG